MEELVILVDIQLPNNHILKLIWKQKNYIMPYSLSSFFLHYHATIKE